MAPTAKRQKVVAPVTAAALNNRWGKRMVDLRGNDSNLEFHVHTKPLREHSPYIRRELEKPTRSDLYILNNIDSDTLGIIIDWCYERPLKYQPGAGGPADVLESMKDLYFAALELEMPKLADKAIELAARVGLAQGHLMLRPAVVQRVYECTRDSGVRSFLVDIWVWQKVSSPKETACDFLKQKELPIEFCQDVGLELANMIQLMAVKRESTENTIKKGESPYTHFEMARYEYTEQTTIEIVDEIEIDDDDQGNPQVVPLVDRRKRCSAPADANAAEHQAGEDFVDITGEDN